MEKYIENYYIAKVGEMWVSQAWNAIGKIDLTQDKKFAQHLNEENANWVYEQIGSSAQLIKVSVHVEEVEV